MVAKRPRLIPDRFCGITGTNASPRGLRSDRGATIVEYALVLALVVVGSIAAINALDSRGREQVINQAECVSMRPPPPGCQITPITTSTSLAPPITGSTLAPAEPTTPKLTAVGAARVSEPSEMPRWAEFDVKLGREIPIDYGGGEEPVVGVAIRAEARMVDPSSPAHYLPEVAYPFCVTDSMGTCTISFDVPFDDVTEISIYVRQVDFPGEVETDPPIFFEYQW